MVCLHYFNQKCLILLLKMSHFGYNLDTSLKILYHFMINNISPYSLSKPLRSIIDLSSSDNDNDFDFDLIYPRKYQTY